MGTKHDILTEDELAGFTTDWFLLNLLDGYMKSHPGTEPGQIRVLDWGCGRGRTVLKLRDKGFEAYGVDIDTDVLKNGYDIIRGRGLNPEDIIKPVSASGSFPDGFFDIIFSEQVLEHVADLDAVVSEMSRLSAEGAESYHMFPGKYHVREVHLHMPYVHWLPKNFIRKYYISAMLKKGITPPEGSFREAEGKPFSEKRDIIYRYSVNKTHYRDINKIISVFNKYGMTADYKLEKQSAHTSSALGLLTRNGYPDSQIRLYSKKD